MKYMKMENRLKYGNDLWQMIVVMYSTEKLITGTECNKKELMK